MIIIIVLIQIYFHSFYTLVYALLKFILRILTIKSRAKLIKQNRNNKHLLLKLFLLFQIKSILKLYNQKLLNNSFI